MKRIAYVQSDDAGLPYSVNGMAAAKGFAYLGYEVRFFRREELETLPLSPETVVVGGMGTVRRAMEVIGLRIPSDISAPAILSPFLGRKSWRTTIGAVQRAGIYPVFLKPFEQAKAFSGLVVKSHAELDSLLEHREGSPAIDDDFPVIAQQPVVFKSEWRTFVVRGVIIGINFYRGDPLALPAPNVIHRAIGAFEHAPAGYSADFGVTDTGDTLLVEINDGYSLGHGALTSNLYAELLEARWVEIASA